MSTIKLPWAGKDFSLTSRIFCLPSLFVMAIIALLISSSAALCATKVVDWEKELQKGYRDLSLGNTDQAMEFFENKVKKYPESGACHTALGTALKKKGKLSEAKSEFAKATEVDCQYANGFYELGSMLESNKDYAKAAQSFEQYLKLSPDSNLSASVGQRLKFCNEQL